MTTTTTFMEIISDLRAGYENGEVLATDIKEMREAMNELGKEVTAAEAENKKAVKEAEKEELATKGKALVKKGEEITVEYKGQEITGTVVKIAEKTFTIETEIDGEAKKVWRYYHQVVLD